MKATATARILPRVKTEVPTEVPTDEEINHGWGNVSSDDEVSEEGGDVVVTCPSPSLPG